MRKKRMLISTLILAFILVQVMTNTVRATVENLTLKEAENNICKIDLKDDGTLTKKLLSVDDENKEATLQIDITSNELKINPSEIMLVIDNSKSMTDNIQGTDKTRRDAVFTAAKELIASILKDQSETKIGVVSFSTSIDASKEGTLDDANLVSKQTNNQTDLDAAIDSIQTTGIRTNIDAGLQIAKNNFSGDEKNSKYLILLSDGVPNTAVGGPIMTYSGEVSTKTKTTLKGIIENNINIITVMTGVNSTYQPDPMGSTSIEAKGKTYKDLAEEIFGTEEEPAFGKFYYVNDEKAISTITTEVYADVTKKQNDKLKNITVIDYFPEEIIANYDFSIIEKANIGTVTPAVDEENNSITWMIEELKAGEKASFKYKLKLKEKYDEKILDVIMPTNKKVDVSYINYEEKNELATSDISPKIVLKGDTTTAPTTIPQTGEKHYIGMISIAVIAIIMVILIKMYKIRK